jgi:hypothetical protein
MQISKLTTILSHSLSHIIVCIKYVLVDENVVIGSVPASAGKSSITEFGKVNELGEKFAAKR